MRRWWWVLLVTSSVGVAGPFELVPAGHDSYQQLAVLRGAGLLDRGSPDVADGQRTRFEFAQLWTVAFESLQRRLGGHSRDVARPHSHVAQVADAMLQLLAAYRPELEQIEVDPDTAADLLRALPDRLPDLSPPSAALTPAPVRAGPAGTSGAAVPGRRRGPSGGLQNDPFTIGVDPRLMPGTAATSLSGRLPAAELGSAAAGLSLSEVTLFEYDDAGPAEFLKGHVLAADLRLKLGDNSVLLEYARSTTERYGTLLDGAAGDAFKATYERELSNHLSVDLGFHRLSSKFTPFSDMFVGQSAAGMYGLRAGLALDTGGLGLRSQATVYRPEGQRVGFANRFDTELHYQFNDNFQLDLGYVTATRRRLTHLEDALLQQYTAGFQFGESDTFWTAIRLQLESDQTRGGTAYDHVIGASLGLGF